MVRYTEPINVISNTNGIKSKNYTIMLINTENLFTKWICLDDKNSKESNIRVNIPENIKKYTINPNPTLSYVKKNVKKSS